MEVAHCIRIHAIRQWTEKIRENRQFELYLLGILIHNRSTHQTGLGDPKNETREKYLFKEM